jgi:hypothetical protein
MLNVEAAAQQLETSCGSGSHVYSSIVYARHRASHLFLAVGFSFLRAIITIMWVASFDDRTCRVCRYLNSYVWRIVADELPRVISHRHYGDVYDLAADESLAHGYG